MSILLDALKKSEAQRRLGEVPTLQTNVSSDGSRGGPRRPWIAFALVLLSAAIMSWTGIAQFSGVDTDPPSADQANASAVAGSAEAAADASPPPGTAEKPRTGSTGNRTRSKNARAANPATTPVQDYAAPEDAHEASEAPSREVAHVEIENRTAPEPVRATAPVADGQAATGAPVVTDQGTYSTQTISYWQVPPPVREEMGEFRISVLVYSENPADRFLLLNGSRLREQEKAESGVVLESIQRNRAVFSYRNYLFHIQR